jgi:hypothetical protein
VNDQLRKGPDGLWRDEAEEVGAAVATSGAFVGWIDVRWRGPAEPQPWLRDAVHLPVGFTEAELAEAMVAAREHRARAVQTCRYCERSFVPGHMHSDDVCQGCAERHLGVIH